MFSYPMHLSRDGSGWLVRFPDIPEAITGALTKAEALQLAQDALEVAMDFYFEDKRQVPLPSKAKPGELAVTLPTSMSAKILLLNQIIQDALRPADLARRIGVKPQEVQRLIDLRHASKIDTLDAAFQALGKRLHLTVVVSPEPNNPAGTVIFSEASERTGALGRNMKPVKGGIVKKDDSFYIEKRTQGDFAVRKANAVRASATAPTQAKAIEKAKQLNPSAALHVARVRHTGRGDPDKWRKIS